MHYKNARDVLPDRLLKELQQYVSGETIYIPRSDTGVRKNWGENSGARMYYKTRNTEIRTKFKEGVKMEALADEYGLSMDMIRKILYQQSKK